MVSMSYKNCDILDGHKKCRVLVHMNHFNWRSKQYMIHPCHFKSKDESLGSPLRMANAIEMGYGIEN